MQIQMAIIYSDRGRLVEYLNKGQRLVSEIIYLRCCAE